MARGTKGKAPQKGFLPAVFLGLLFAGSNAIAPKVTHGLDQDVTLHSHGLEWPHPLSKPGGALSKERTASL